MFRPLGALLNARPFYLAIKTEIIHCLNLLWRREQLCSFYQPLTKGPGERGHIVADTNVSPFARALNICCGHKKCFWFWSETFCVRNKCFPVCAAQETSRATMYPRQFGLVCQSLNLQSVPALHHFVGSRLRVLFHMFWEAYIAQGRQTSVCW